ncbi:uncharacterized protein LOC119688687 [Teleopsis dalmanni]|uniref:uncharacterized protein LOC119688687 n=1 Tax=Teleopsis dalmanni TaxID=139649 RepID=UPI0018CCE7F7|nr:uncharacterized protein LOC119688687 [Teleopsis dalmanni]
MYVKIKSHILKYLKFFSKWWTYFKSRDLDNLTNFIQSYLESSGIHGLFFLVYRRLVIIERYFWLLLVIISTYICIKIGLQSVDRFYTKSTVVGLERDYHQWNTTMPATTVCPLKRLDSQLFNAFCRDHNIPDREHDELFQFLESLANSTFINFKEIKVYNQIDRILDKLKIKPKNYMELIYNLTVDNTFQNISDMKHIYSRIYGSSGDGFLHSRQILTEYGLCYNLNTLLDTSYSATYFIFGKHPEVPKKGRNFLSSKWGNYFEEEMIYNFEGFISTPIDTFIHSPFEVMQVDHNMGYTLDPMTYEVECLEIITEVGFKTGASISQRQCRFLHESNLTHFPIYTKNLCLQECRLNLIYKLCKCIPHFYPNRVSNPKPVCDYRTLRECLPKYETVFLKLHGYNESGRYEDVQCYCLENCRDILISKGRTIEMFGEATLMLDSVGIIISMTNRPTSRLIRQIIFSLTDLLVAIGGTAGLFLGVNVLGIIEIIYYFTLHLFWHLRGYK